MNRDTLDEDIKKTRLNSVKEGVSEVGMVIIAREVAKLVQYIIDSDLEADVVLYGGTVLLKTDDNLVAEYVTHSIDCDRNAALMYMFLRKLVYRGLVTLDCNVIRVRKDYQYE